VPGAAEGRDGELAGGGANVGADGGGATKDILVADGVAGGISCGGDANMGTGSVGGGVKLFTALAKLCICGGGAKAYSWADTVGICGGGGSGRRITDGLTHGEKGWLFRNDGIEG